MMSTAGERLRVIHEAYSGAYARRLQDWKEAASTAQAGAISTNLYRLEESYLRAARQSLEANGSAVEAAYASAKQAQKDVEDAYRNAKALPEKIRLVSSIVTSVGDLVRKAGEAAQ